MVYFISGGYWLVSRENRILKNRKLQNIVEKHQGLKSMFIGCDTLNGSNLMYLYRYPIQFYFWGSCKI